MAVSKKRDKEVYKAPRKLGKPESKNPKWLVPTAVTLLIVGLLWILVFYTVPGVSWPLPIGNYNLAVGFAFMTGGMVVLTRWE